VELRIDFSPGGNGASIIPISQGGTEGAGVRGLVPGSQSELNRLRALNLFRGVEQLDRNEMARPVVIKDQPRARLIAFGDFAVAKNNGQSVCYFVVDHFHDYLQYLSTLLVLYAVTTW